MQIIRRFAATMLALCAAVSAHAEEGVSDNRILIGRTNGVTGQIAGPVKEMNDGADAYIAWINRRGGVNGRHIEIVTLDDRFDPAVTAKNAETLVKERHVFALFQSRGTPHTQAILPVLEASRVPLVAPSTGAAVFHEPVHPLVFNVRAKYQDEVIKAVRHFATSGVQRIALVHVDDAFGKDGHDGFAKGMDALGLKPAAVVKFDRTKPDIDATVADVMKADPQAIVLVASAGTAAPMIKAVRAAGSRAHIMTLSNNSARSFVESVGKDGNGVIVSQVTPPADLITTPLGQEFRQAAKENHAVASYAAMEGFISAKVLVEGLQRAGRNLTREGFIRALESIRKEDIGGLLLTYGPNRHTGSEYVELTIIGKDGRFLR
jgi:ABC-type branched-subunit amino acid transport system substrate-binding protein